MSSERSHRSIGEVLSLLQEEFPDITISKIRFLESQGLLEPERTPSGYRKFFDPDVERLRWILLQQRDHFLPLKVIRERLGAGEFETWVAAGADPATLAPVAIQPPLGPEVAAPSEPDPAVNGEAADSEPTAVVDVVQVEAMVDVVQVEATVELDPVRDDAPPAPDGGPDLIDEPHRFDAILSAARRVVDRRDEDDPGEAPGQVTGELDQPADEQPAPPVPPPLTAGPLDTGSTTASMTVDELCRASGLDPHELGELERFGLLSSRTVGPAVYYDGEALVVARLAAAFLRHGIEARHLRMYKTAAEREAGVFEQVVAPLVGRKDGAARREARERLVEMARLGEALHAALLRSALRGYVESD